MLAKIISTYGSLLLEAMGQTLLLALCGLFFACILGLIFGLLSVLRSRVCNIISTIFVDVIRGLPMIVLAFFIYFGIPQLINTFMVGTRFTLSALQAGTIALALNCGAYMSEIIRAGIQSVDKGQMEAARSLALLEIHAQGRAAAGHSHDDPVDHQPVYHHAQGYLDPVGHRFPGAGQHGQKRAGKYHAPV